MGCQPVQSVFVSGAAASFTWADARFSLTDLIYECVKKALADAGIGASDVDAVVLAAHDLVDGRGLTSMVTAPAAATYLKDETRLGEDGATAFILGDARVRSGSVRRCLVAAWGRASEGPVDRIANALFDPFTSRALGMTEVAVSGLRATQAIASYPSYGAEREGAARARHGSTDPSRVPSIAWPLRPRELPVWADVVAAAVLSAEPSPVEITGVGMSTEPFDVGDRDLLSLPALRQASDQALRAAELGIEDIDVLELDGLTLFDDALAVEAVGAAPQGQGMHAMANGLAVNTGGGSSAGYCAPAMGLVRIISAYRRVVEEGATAALATGSSVVASQNQAAVVLSHKITR
jgi:acetyl-CoA C-acetyltransferase